MKLVRALVVMLAAVLVVTGMGAAPTSAASSTPVCTDVYILGARGTDQPQNDKGIGGWYADVIGRTVDQFKAQVRDRDPSMRFHDIALTKDEYPADSGFYFTGAILHLPSTYYKSVTKGKESGRKRVNAVIGGAGACVLFTGYSQGAQVTADLLAEYTASHPAKVLGGIFYGDPYFRGDSKHSSSGRWPNAFNRSQHGGLGQRAEFASSLQSRVISTCHGKDPVCQGVSWKAPTCHVTATFIVYCSPPTPDIDLDAHSAYTRDASNPANRGNDMTAEAADSARAIVSRMGFVRPTAPQYAGPVDIVFAVDTTGSMGGVIEDAKTYVRSFPAANDASLPDVRYGLVAYKDVGDEYVTQVEVQPTADRAAFAAGVDGLSADGGGDTPEAVLAAASTAMHTAMRSAARKIVIFVGDAPGHEPDLSTNATLAEVTSEAVGKSIILSAVDYGLGTSTFADMAAATGGKVINPYAGAAAAKSARTGAANDQPRPGQLRARTAPESVAGAAAGDESNPLLDAVLQSVAQPEARLSASVPAYSGTPLTLDASGSTDPIGYIATYEWDFDGDGTYDDETDVASVEHTFRTTGTKEIGVRVTNDVGATGVASATVTVEEQPVGYPTTVPVVPAAPTVVAGDRSVVVKVRANTSGSFAYSYTVLDARTGQVVAIVPAGASGTAPAAVTVTGLTNGTTYSYRVVAGNPVGDSAAGPASVAVRPAAKHRPSRTVLSASRKTSKVGQRVTLVATVSGPRTGRVRFADSGHVLGTARVVGGKAVLPTASLYGGKQTISATFTGSSTHAASTGRTTVTVKDRKRPKLALSFPKGVSAAAPAFAWVARDRGGVRTVRFSVKVGKGTWSSPKSVAASATPRRLPRVTKGVRVCVRVTAADWAGNQSKKRTKCLRMR